LTNFTTENQFNPTALKISKKRRDVAVVVVAVVDVDVDVAALSICICVLVQSSDKRNISSLKLIFQLIKIQQQCQFKC